MIRSIVDRVVRFAWLAVLGALGRLLFFTGRGPRALERAVRVFDALKRADRDSFTAAFYLGLLAANRDQMSEALVHFSRACRSNPRRFWRSRLPSGLKESILLKECLNKDLGLTWKHLEHMQDGADVDHRVAAVERRRCPAEPVVVTHPGGTRRLEQSDFVDDEERRRFARLPAITAEDVAAVDWDDVVKRF